MPRNLTKAVQALNSRGRGINDDEDSWIDASPKVCCDPDYKKEKLCRDVSKRPEIVKRELEEELLSPPTEFSAQWLNKLQRRWDAPVNNVELAELAPTQTRTITRFTREGLQGRVTD